MEITHMGIPHTHPTNLSRSVIINRLMLLSTFSITGHDMLSLDWKKQYQSCSSLLKYLWADNIPQWHIQVKCFTGNLKPDSSINIVHKSNMSSSHGTEVRNLHLSLQVFKSPLNEPTRWSSVPHRWGAMYMMFGIPAGTLKFLLGRMRCAFQTSLISFKSSYSKKRKRDVGWLIVIFQLLTRYSSPFLWWSQDGLLM